MLAQRRVLDLDAIVGAHGRREVAVKGYLWWWALLLSIIVFVGWATGNAHTGADAARYFAFVVIGLIVAGNIIWGFVELRRRSKGGSTPEIPPPTSPPATRRPLVTATAIFALSTSLVIHEASTGADWWAFGIAVIGMILFGGRLLVALTRTRSR
jgi:hypothetical protein